MSSSLSSIILIGVVWLLIIATLVVRRQTPVRRTTRVLSETRVVHEGGTDLGRVRRRPLPAESLYHADPDAEIELVEAEPEQVVIDDTRRDRGGRTDDDLVDDGGVDAGATGDDTRTVTPAVVEGEVIGYRTLDDEDTGEFLPVSVTDARGNRSADVTDDSDAAEDSEYDVAEDVTDDLEDSATTDATVGGEAAEPVRRFAVVDDAYLRGGDIDITVGTDDELPPVAELVPVHGGQAADDSTSDDLTADDLDYAESRRGRGIYDPVASRQLAEDRRRRRFRVLAVLAVITLLSLVGAFTLGGALWLLPVIGVALTGAYLYSLRKQTVAEQELQHRRLARMRRARLGVRNTDDVELGVPDRLLRPGAVVLETDDADPEFAGLDYADVTFAGVDETPEESFAGAGGYGGQTDVHPTIRVI